MQLAAPRYGVSSGSRTVGATAMNSNPLDARRDLLDPAPRSQVVAADHQPGVERPMPVARRQCRSPCPRDATGEVDEPGLGAGNEADVEQAGGICHAVEACELVPMQALDPRPSG